MKKQFVVIGLGAFGTSIAKTLEKKGCQVLAIDEDEKKVQEISQFTTQAVQANATDEKVLKELEVGNMDGAVVSIGENMEASILITLILKEGGLHNSRRKTQR